MSYVLPLASDCKQDSVAEWAHFGNDGYSGLAQGSSSPYIARIGEVVRPAGSVERAFAIDARPQMLHLSVFIPVVRGTNVMTHFEKIGVVNLQANETPPKRLSWLRVPADNMQNAARSSMPSTSNR